MHSKHPTISIVWLKLNLRLEDYEATSTAGNKIEADLEDLALKLSVGKRF